jgi:hypothetical protein
MQRKVQSYGESFSWTYTVLFNDNTSGLMSFYRLICSIYFTKHCTTLLTYSNPEALFDSFSAEDVHDRHILFVTETRERQWERRVFSKNIKKCFLAKASEIGNKITTAVNV